VNAPYAVKPQANLDLDEHADYLSQEASLELGLRFLTAAHETFALLATHPNMGWQARLRHPALKSLRVFRIAGFERMLVLYQPLPDSVDILRVVHGSRNLQALFRRRDEIEPNARRPAL
jgi:toxin ParE1/3/4